MIRGALVAAVLLASLLLVDRVQPVARCTAPPISREALNAAIARPVTPFPENAIPPGRTPVDEATAAQLRDLLQQLDACANAGEPLRVWSLYAPSYLARLFQVQGPFDEATKTLIAVAGVALLAVPALALERLRPAVAGLRLRPVLANGGVDRPPLGDKALDNDRGRLLHQKGRR